MNNSPFVKNILWIANIDSETKKLIRAKINSFDNLPNYETENINLIFFKNNESAIEFIKKHPFEKTDIIFVNTEGGKEFYILIKDKILEYSIIPRIFIIDKNTIHKTYEYYDFLKIPFFHKNLVYFSIKKLCSDLCVKEDFKIQSIPPIKTNKYNLFNFEFINQNQLRLPLYYYKLILQPNDEEIQQFNKFCRNKIFGQKDNNSIIDLRKNENDKEALKYLLEQIERVEKIGIKIPFPNLIKFWLRIYTYETEFYKDMNLTLKNNISINYDIYIRALYNGFKYVPNFFDQILYRGSLISNDEIDKIKENLEKYKKSKKKICLCFTKSFFSCSLNKEEALGFMYHKKPDLKINSYALFKIEKGYKEIDIENVSNADLTNISCHDEEKEILFYPFSSFEIVDLREINEEVSIKNVRGNDVEVLNADMKYYLIELNYLGKYKKNIPPPSNNNKIENSNFANSLLKTSILKKKKLQPEIFQFDIKKYINSITCKYKIPKEEINKSIKLIQYKNDDNSCQIIINNENLFNFQSKYIFQKEGEYTIEFVFNKELENISSLFENCKYLTSIDLSYLNTEKLKLTINMFNKCINLEEFIFNNQNTKSIKNMNGMFCECESLKSIDLSNLDLQNVIDISSMFRDCKTITNIKFFKSKNVKNMDYLFYNCSSLNNLDLTEFDCRNAGEIGHVFGGSFNKQCNIIYIENSKFRTIDPKYSNIFN